MDTFTNLVENKKSAPKALKVRKIYINEDPNVEEIEPCPKCWSQNRQSNVRYMFVSMQEAIFKCEASNCMFPFRDFKYKNYSEQTVYYYQPVVEETPLALTSLTPPQENVATCSKDAQLCKDFNLHFISPERTHSATTRSANSNDLNIFDSPSLSYSNLAEGFDTGFIDDILNELGEVSSPEKKPVIMSPLRPATQEKEATKSNRQLKRCLQMFEETKISDCKTDGIFKVPPLPGTDVCTSPSKLKSKKSFTQKRHSHFRRTNHSSFTSEKYLKKNRLKPLQFLESLNNIRQAEDIRKKTKESTHMPGIQRLSNQKVARMLDFIERSMKNKAPTPESVTRPQMDLVANFVIPEQSPPTRKRRESKRLSLSETVLQDTQFEYSSTDDELLRSPSKLTQMNDPIKEDPREESQPVTDEMRLPSFAELVHFVHPEQLPCGKLGTYASAVTGVRSAGCSPTRVEQWEVTPPRRIHSMESLSSLLE
ncbi:uncharacterized protein LOC131688577 [Topomyia yanbarensis]|uniref:uncharacterized protein LOC131688577 n=1 Tax=Topomyia yanbarensis TaxID=2498891 RepID=UPI00273A7739|nr:uncharacterized protein LOC131688577 [Topomyia yanbarensis]